MNLIFRLMVVLIGARIRRRHGFAEPFDLHSRVWPFDLDLNLHMTNSRYLALADLGRLDLVLRTGTWRAIWQGRLGVVLGGCTIRFRRALRPFERFTLRTSILGWDERWIYVRQVFTGKHGVACIAVMRAGLTRKGTLVPPQDVFDAASSPIAQMHPPAWIAAWNDLETAYISDATGAGL